MLQVHFKLDRMAEQVGHAPGSYIQVTGQAGDDGAGSDANGSHGGFVTQFISNGDENGDGDIDGDDDGDKNGDRDGDENGKSIHLAGRWSSMCSSASR